MRAGGNAPVINRPRHHVQSKSVSGPPESKLPGIAELGRA
jgi:hypothetical protein